MDTKEIRANSVDYWNGNARWYELWIEHNNYHEGIIAILKSIAKPGWKVLDIGGGGGVLAIPLMISGCEVVVVEPSQGMRGLLARAMTAMDTASTITVDARAWEEIPPLDLAKHDLIVASNSLHLVAQGFQQAIRRLFNARATRIFIVTEKPVHRLDSYAEATGYRLILSQTERKESSYVYHSREEALEHWAFKHGRYPDTAEEGEILSGLSEEGGHLRMKGRATIHTYCWRKVEDGSW